MKTYNLLIPGVSISIKDLFTLPEEEKPETKRKRKAQEKAQNNKIELLFNTILNGDFIAARKTQKPNKDTQKGLIYILTKSIRNGYKLQLSCFLKDYKSGEIIALDHQDIITLDDLKREIKTTSGQRWQIEKY